MSPFLAILLTFVAIAAALIAVIRSRNMHIWLWAYLTQPRLPETRGPTHLLFCFVDHFEPQWNKPGYEEEVRRVSAWRNRYAEIAARHQDADGFPPAHTFFYPEEEYRKEHLDQLESLCRAGYGEIEVHLHHDNDTSAGLTAKLQRFIRVLHDVHGALPVNPQTGKPSFGFIHGNWCLDNSRRDGRYCGINDELRVLARNGCYADFTMPSAPSDTQTCKINSIYYAVDDPDQPKSHNTGVDAMVGRGASGELMLIQGPLTLDWTNRKWGVIPRIENGDIRRGRWPTPERVARWVDQGIHVKGRPEWVFVKIHTHGTQDHDQEEFIARACGQLFEVLERRYNDGMRYQLHYVSAREMYNIAKAAESGATGDPSNYRDYLLPRPYPRPPRSAHREAIH